MGLNLREQIDALSALNAKRADAAAEQRDGKIKRLDAQIVVVKRELRNAILKAIAVPAGATVSLGILALWLMLRDGDMARFSVDEDVLRKLPQIGDCLGMAGCPDDMPEPDRFRSFDFFRYVPPLGADVEKKFVGEDRKTVIHVSDFHHGGPTMPEENLIYVVESQRMVFMVLDELVQLHGQIPVVFEDVPFGFEIDKIGEIFYKNPVVVNAVNDVLSVKDMAGRFEKGLQYLHEGVLPAGLFVMIMMPDEVIPVFASSQKLLEGEEGLLPDIQAVIAMARFPETLSSYACEGSAMNMREIIALAQSGGQLSPEAGQCFCDLKGRVDAVVDDVKLRRVAVAGAPGREVSAALRAQSDVVVIVSGNGHSKGIDQALDLAGVNRIRVFHPDLGNGKNPRDGGIDAYRVQDPQGVCVEY